MEELISKFQIKGECKSIQLIESGLINTTYKVITSTEKYILQEINTLVFEQVDELMENINNITSFLDKKGKKTLQIVLNKKGGLVIFENGKYWRMFYFIENSLTFNSVKNINIVKEGAKELALFHKNLFDFPSHKLHVVIPNFHNTEYIFSKFKNTLDICGNQIKKECEEEIRYILKNEDKYKIISNLITERKIPIRVCHYDPKISNILFDKKLKSICIIDLDTTMPGTILHDFSDSVRTICVSNSEEESNLSKVEFKLNYFKAYSQTYLDINSKNLNNFEINHLTHSVENIFLEQGMRFLNDYLLGDIYYKTTHKKQNLIRAQNQIHLAKLVKENYIEMENIILECFN